MWPFNLSVRLPIADLVGRYPTNYLIGREPISQRIAPLIAVPCDTTILCGISVCFQTLSPSERQVAHALLTRPPLTQILDFRYQISDIPSQVASETSDLKTVLCPFPYPYVPSPSFVVSRLLSDVCSLTSVSVRLACVRHAASVRPEPGSNSLKNCIISALAGTHNLSELSLLIRYSSVS